MVLKNRIMFKKLPRFLQRLLRMLGMAPEPPNFDGLFTLYGQRAFLTSSIELWYRKCIRDNPFTLDCLVIKISWYKKQNGVEHEFLRFDILSPDRVHTSIVIAERGGGVRNQSRDPSDATQPTDTIAPLHTTAGAVTPPDAITPSFSSQDVAEDSTTNGRTNEKARRSAHISSTSSSFQRSAHDLVSYATLDSSASAELEWKCKKAARICTLMFPEGVGPSANELATLLYVTSKHEPTYTITNTQCYWFVDTVFEALKSLFPGAQQDIANHRGGTWNRVRIRTKESVDEVCGKYRAARTALAEEAQQKHRAEQQQEEERQREREQRQVAEEVAKREREKRQVAEEQRQAAEEQRQAAEEQRQAAEEWAREMEEERERERQAAEERAREMEEERQKERQAAEEEIAQLRRELKASRARATAQQV
ncbi:hypothetical protein EDC04DRAFT_380225 [Pisolithus marmoratus]|nr:hypothetical protein EDC04DRAFT_380225 [Pisolithus marmoratus]